MRWTRAAVLATSLTFVLAGCGAGPSDRPGVAVEHPVAPGGGAGTSQAPPAPPRAAVPKTDLAWSDCTRGTFDQLGLGAPPNGVILECAEYSTPIDTAGTVIGNFRNGAVRARLPQTPADAPPLVLTSGADRASSATLAALAAGPPNGILATRPIVAVDRRGIGTSQPVDCLPVEVRQGFADNAQFARLGDAAAQAEALVGFSQDGTIACRDFLQPYENTFDVGHAADDIEQLRKEWQVDHIDLLGTGNGAEVAVSYARKFGDHLSRLVLDSPTSLGADATTVGEQRAQGAEAALTAFAQRCTALGCALGPDPRAAITDLVNRAAAGQLGDLSANAVTTALTGFLGSPRADQADRVPELADALAAAGRGNRGPLLALIQRQSAAIANDGEFVNRCADVRQPPTPSRAVELAGDWAGKYPVFGRSAALALLTCAAWPVGTPPPAIADFALPVLVLDGAADPVAGGVGQAAVTGALAGAGARTAVLRWQGWGHPVSARSGCGQRAVVEYLNEARLPQDGSACPA
ncbi:alpha/beta hydrolase [Nocardia asteroides]|uniref:alpha/beta hydrolase n=1 Tax=Nocardia asteroides TaxID=1824 RepID=UPI001E2B6F64|nr:alpha/beta hydrolase [Nocardia asteroides]UGT63426.1 alpha/beta hydrolase [Nocardia asteroides]